MERRICDVDGKEEELYGGKTCLKHHFICKKHNYGKSRCPICDTPLS